MFYIDLERIRHEALQMDEYAYDLIQNMIKTIDASSILRDMSSFDDVLGHLDTITSEMFREVRGIQNTAYQLSRIETEYRKTEENIIY